MHCPRCSKFMDFYGIKYIEAQPKRSVKELWERWDACKCGMYALTTVNGSLIRYTTIEAKKGYFGGA